MSLPTITTSQHATTTANRRKSIFIGIAPMLGMVVMVWSTRQLAITSEIAWLAPILTIAPFLLFVAFIMSTRSIARTSAHFPLVNLVAVGGVVMAAVLAARGGSWLPVVLAGLGASLTAIYSFWYSNFGRTASRRLAVGRPLPEFSLLRSDRSLFSTHTLLGRPALLMFYRGNWCPLCMAQIKELAARYREIEQLGARVVMISPQPHENSAALAKRFGVQMEFLTDEDNAAARTLEIEMKHGLPMGMGMFGYAVDTVFPTVVITDAHGIIQWVDETDNYRVRPEPDTFLPILARLAS